MLSLHPFPVKQYLEYLKAGSDQAADQNRADTHTVLCIIERCVITTLTLCIVYTYILSIFYLFTVILIINLISGCGAAVEAGVT